MKIERTSALEKPKLNMLVYGPPGSGKTRFTGTTKPRFNPIILSAESGLLSLSALKDANGKPYDFDFVKIENFDQLTEARQELRYGKHSYDTVIMDSITEIQQVCMDKILHDEKREKPEIRDWGTLSMRMISLIRDFREMNLNFIVTALSESRINEDTGISVAAPMVQGSLREKLAGYFDEVFYLHAKEDKDKDGNPIIKRAFQTQGSNKVQAKDRSGKLPLFAPPDFCKIYDRIFAAEENKQ